MQVNELNSYEKLHLIAFDYRGNILLMLSSYKNICFHKLIEGKNQKRQLFCIEDKQKFQRLLSDVAWFKTLPLYIELEAKKTTNQL